MSVSLTPKTRLKLIAKVLRMKSFEMYIEPWKVASEVNSSYVCDNNRYASGCNNKSQVCVSRTYINFQVSDDWDHKHVCNECASKYVGTNKEWERYVGAK